MGRVVLAAVAVCALAAACGSDKRTATTTEHIAYRLSVSSASGKGAQGGSSDLLEPPHRPLTRAAAAREVRAYMRRHYDEVVTPRCARDDQFMACWFRRRGGCARLEVQGAYNGATPVVISGVVPARRSSCP